MGWKLLQLIIEYTCDRKGCGHKMLVTGSDRSECEELAKSRGWIIKERRHLSAICLCYDCCETALPEETT